MELVWCEGRPAVPRHGQGGPAPTLRQALLATTAIHLHVHGDDRLAGAHHHGGGSRARLPQVSHAAIAELVEEGRRLPHLCQKFSGSRRRRHWRP